jgi:8-oxo-dGTP pyrophosphatase MutT (NUDIX family)
MAVVTLMLQASGCILIARTTGRVLFQFRAKDRRRRSYWGIWGGKSENEQPIDNVKRELAEELGELPDLQKVYPIHKMVSDDGGFEYNTFLSIIPDEFVPTINKESQGYAWVDFGCWPYPLHPGLKDVLQNPRIYSKITTILSTLK